ncbi:threonine aldolase family protein [Branchiibius cervicis]|uniref:Threonine aldolase family protein n=1 Tax=Branchiibius cervicis TaxID=908252 RepID=A0ABW2AX07_9MICO
MTSLHDASARGFASDNYAGVHPEVLDALAAANGGHQVAYGEDDYTAALRERMAELFEAPVEVFPVFNGTGANVVALQSVTHRWESVICAETAHINVDEGAAPESVGHLKLKTIPTPDGKLTPQLLEAFPLRVGDEHAAPVGAVSITQTTELGTAYTVEEIRQIATWAHAHDLVLHVDGSRISNAVASLGVSLAELITDTGVDILSFGGTKNGLLGAEAVVVLNPAAVHGIVFLRKQSMQLASKMRFLSAQLLALLSDDLYLRSAQHANEMATRLAAAVSDVVTLPRPTQANAVFAVLPQEVSLKLTETFRFYFWDEVTGEVRWMCSWDTTEDDVDAFAAAVRDEIAAYRSA